METTLAEIALIVAVAYAFYLLMRPLQRRLEDRILDFLDPERARIIDVEPLKDRRENKPKE